MKLSVIVVNYNVKFFLEQCLISVRNALKGIESEVFVVDNASADGSCQLVRERFPEVNLISNRENFGFSYANNQAMRIAKGEYILLLNPDTVVEEETFRKCIGFMDMHPEAGSLAVKMIDGKGRFLPESKRALPSPMVSFYKIFGFSRLFPRSKVFARYHLGHLNENETHEIEILPGAFMFMRKTALDKAGLLDEDFFMYGEDIDLSYRILKSGFKNFYFPETTIIHYKGESTKKGSINYVLVFYKAMIIFARKHFSKKNAQAYTILIYLAIYFRAFLSLSKRFFRSIFFPLIDSLLIALGFWLIPLLWEKYWYQIENYYSEDLIIFMSLVFITISILSAWLVGAYEKPQKLLAAAKGIGIGALIFIFIYALLPENFRFSRAVIILTSLWAIVAVQLNHMVFGLFRADYFPGLRRKKRIAIVGTPSEARRVHSIVIEAAAATHYVGLVSPTEAYEGSEYTASLSQLREFVRVNGVDEVIFCANDLTSQEIIKNMLLLVSTGVDYKIAPPDSLSVIGSNSIDTQGELYTVDIKAISKPSNRRAKRFFDVIATLALMLTLPFFALVKARNLLLYRYVFAVLFAQKSWIGYLVCSTADSSHLPQIREGVFPPTLTGTKNKTNEEVERINLLYAKNYSVLKDLELLWKNLFFHK
jgi:GT2 family glycosyltransferase